jgi:hypothetical protein
VDILCQHASVFCGYSYRVTTPERLFEDTYQKALARAFMRAATLSNESGSKAHIVFAKTEEISIELVGRFFDRLHWDEFLRGYSVLRSRDEPALQAAEIVARGFKRKMQDGLITHSMARLIATGKQFEIEDRF